ncbi:glycosyltransferase family 4 protein [Porticoccaceae bacterium]|nr:glycosyltransferase family 4 protein [Porticoccaceae bacterium]
MVSVYSQAMDPFLHVATTPNKSTFVNLLYLPVAIVKYLYFLCVRPIEIIHIHSASRNSFLRKSIFVLLGSIFRKKIILHIHSGHFEGWFLQNRRYVNFILLHVDLMIGLSESMVRFFNEELGHSSVVMLGNPVPKPNNARQSSRFAGVHALFLGDVIEQKGVFDLVDAVSKLPRIIRKGLRITIGGNGELRKLEAMISEAGLEEVFELAGWVVGAEKKRLFSTCDFYILPSYHEGLPVSIIEAMSYGMPILSTSVGGIPEIVIDGENGRLVEPGNVEELTFALEWFITHPDTLLSMGMNSLKRGEEFYSPKVIEKLEYIYIALLED